MLKNKGQKTRKFFNHDFLARNRRGNVPTTILVFGVVAICILTILSFYVSSLNTNKNFDIESVKEAKLIKEKIGFYENLGWSQSQIDSFLDIKTDSLGRYILIDKKSISVRYNLP